MWLRCPACEARLELPDADLPIERVVVSCRCGAATRLVAQVARTPEEAQEKRLLARIEHQLQEGAIELPTLPQAAAQILRCTRDAAATVRDLAGVIECDPGISVRLLQLANSTLYRGRFEAQTVQQAVSRMGLQAVRFLVIGLLSKGVYRTPERRLRRLVERLWRHAVRVGVTARAVARSSLVVGASARGGETAELRDAVDPDLAFTGGLLHDVGKVVLLQLLTRTSADVVRSWSEPRIERVIGRFHDAVGGKLLEAWELNADLCAVAREHHRIPVTLAETSRERLVATVALANAICHASAKGADAGVALLAETPPAKALGVSRDGLRGAWELAERFQAEAGSILT